MSNIEQLKENIELLKNSDDPEFVDLIQQEITRIKEELTFEDDDDKKNAILEIRAGTGGEEAELFAAELSRMYIKFSERKGWKVSINEKKETSIGGLKELIATITGIDVYGQLKYEAGIHRVQRVPKTEKQGRIHTSAATVVVLPEVEAKEFELKTSDIKIDVYRSGGHGGQSVNTTDSAVRMTHLPTGIVVICQDERSQLKNREKAMAILRSRIWAKEQDDLKNSNSEKRLSIVKSGDRSEKIRTYNYPQDRITDHRIPKSYNNMEKYLNGDIEQIITDLKKVDTQNILEGILKESSLS